LAASRLPPDHDHQLGAGPQRSAIVVAKAILDLKTGVKEQQPKLARKVHVAFEVVDIALDKTFAMILFIQKTDLRPLLVR
jgi:hypothetical protein